MKTLRAKIKLLRENMTIGEVQTLSSAVYSNLFSLDYMREKSTFFVYKSFRNEVDTSAIINELLKQNKTVSHPLIIGDKMISALPTSSEWVKDAFDIETPKDYKELSSAIIPLIACDTNKNRVGFGKGYYDRFLSETPCIKIGLCYDFQVTETITPNPWDVKLDYIITPTKIIK